MKEIRNPHSGFMKAPTPPPEISEGWEPHWRIPKKLRQYRDPMFDLVEGECKIVVEIGSCWGWWAFRACTQLPDAEVFCVDPWLDMEIPAGRHGPRNVARTRNGWLKGADNFSEWALNLRPFILTRRAFALRDYSDRMAEYFKLPIDFLFIDGDHHAPAVLADLQAWVPKVREGGLVVGHDWDGVWGENVQKGVLNYWNRNQFKVDKLYWSGKHLGECFYKKV